MHPPVNPNVKFTYEDYCSLRYDDKRYEVIEGELLLTPSPRVIHQVVCQRIEDALTRHNDVYQQGIVLHAPLDVVLSDVNIVQPDVLFISRNRTAIIGETNISGAPDFIVEVLSPGNKERDLKAKRSLYSRFGVQEYWIVDPDQRSVAQLVYQRDGLVTKAVVPEGGEVASQIVPGFTLSLDGQFDFKP